MVTHDWGGGLGGENGVQGVIWGSGEEEETKNSGDVVVRGLRPDGFLAAGCGPCLNRP